VSPVRESRSPVRDRFDANVSADSIARGKRVAGLQVDTLYTDGMDLGQDLGFEEDEASSGSCSGETSPLGLSLLYQKRARQIPLAGPLAPLQTEDLNEGSELENKGLETSPLGKALLSRKRFHAHRRMLAGEGSELRDIGSCLNSEAGL
jgi:hypothetical protein